MEINELFVTILMSKHYSFNSGCEWKSQPSWKPRNKTRLVDFLVVLWEKNYVTNGVQTG